MTRQDDAWLADVPGLEGASTYARGLGQLEKCVREVVVLAAGPPSDEPDSSIWTGISAPATLRWTVS